MRPTQLDLRVVTSPTPTLEGDAIGRSRSEHGAGLPDERGIDDDTADLPQIEHRSVVGRDRLPRGLVAERSDDDRSGSDDDGRALAQHAEVGAVDRSTGPVESNGSHAVGGADEQRQIIDAIAVPIADGQAPERLGSASSVDTSISRP